MAKIFVLLCFFVVFIRCGSEANLASIDFDSCFLNYKDRSELTDSLNKLKPSVSATDKPSKSSLAVMGCLNYQQGNYTLAEQLLIRAFKESNKKVEIRTKNVAAAALSLIYLKASSEGSPARRAEKKKIKPYIAFAKQHPLGRWMLVLYHIDSYRETGAKKHLLLAGAQMEEKHLQEGSTPASLRFKQHIDLIVQMASVCGADDPKAQASCEMSDFIEEKRYLFSTAQGFLSMLVKEPPFNTRIAPVSSDNTSDVSSEDGGDSSTTIPPSSPSSS